MSDTEDQQSQQQQNVGDDFEPLESGDAGERQPAEASATPVVPDGPSADADVAVTAPGSERMLLCCSYLERADPKLKSLLLWSDPKRSAAVLFASLTLLWACMAQSFISVLAYLGLAALLCTCAVRLYAYTMKRGGSASGDGADYDLLACLQEPVRLPRRCVLDFIDRRLECMEREANCLLELLLFRDSMRTLKFFVGLIVLTYVGCWFNALTLVSMAVVSGFCLPKVYSVYHRQVDAALGQGLDRYRQVSAKIRAAIPFGKDKKN